MVAIYRPTNQINEWTKRESEWERNTERACLTQSTSKWQPDGRFSWIWSTHNTASRTPYRPTDWTVNEKKREKNRKKNIKKNSLYSWRRAEWERERDQVYYYYYIFFLIEFVLLFCFRFVLFFSFEKTWTAIRFLLLFFIDFCLGLSSSKEKTLSIHIESK